ncbi:DUF808 domain-containing protein [Methyloterricola oryzae]|uniref:DUF808 domain-containing protein n=1 Tax=Methyloterricola oryzae TaxID=1495050 RepID=UPI0005EB846E|nr:DUF808 domain-containing protein [Methyloterricola oryzae]
MAGSSLFALIDDIASLLDDISLMTKVAAKKTAGVLGDDLALNAQQVAGVGAERELPVVWAVAKGSVGNKLILVPAALALSAFAPWAVSPLLMLGGLYLCFEGFEKIAHGFLVGRGESSQADPDGAKMRLEVLSGLDLVDLEKAKIRGAIRTDFVLSAEIIVIALGTVQSTALATQIAVLSAIALLMTVGVYGLVAGIVKLDDAGLYLVRSGNGLLGGLGRFILGLAPLLMKALSVAGTAAMFLVGGGILVHGMPVLHAVLPELPAWSEALPVPGEWVLPIMPLLLNGLVGLAAGAAALLVVSAASRMRGWLGFPAH